LPPCSHIKFQDINDDDDEFSPPPTPKKRKGGKPKPQNLLVEIEIFKKAFERCLKGKRDCSVDVVGAACSNCKAKKYGCSQRGKNDAETMWVTWPAVQTGTEIKVLSNSKGKK